MQGWTKTGVRTERVIVDGRAFDAPLLVMQSGEILPFVVQFPEEASQGDSPGLRKRHDVAESLLDAVHMLSTVRDACREARMEKAGQEIVTSSLELIFDGTALYRASERDGEVHKLCVLISRQLAMDLLTLRVRRAVFRALKVGDSNIFYRKFICDPTRDKKDGSVTELFRRTQIVTQCVKHYRDEERTPPSRGHVYEIIQAAGTTRLPGLSSDPPIAGSEGETGKGIEFVPLAPTSDALEDLCSGHPYGQFLGEDPPAQSAPFCYGHKPHVCCSLPTVEPPSGVCCETQLHNLFVTMWQPWGIEEDLAFVTFACLLIDGVPMCERMHCYGLTPRTVRSAK